MSARGHVLALCLSATAYGGCGFALAQTAKVLPKGEGNTAIGGGVLSSQVDADRGGWRAPQDVATELGGRIGAGHSTDIGVNGYLGLGAMVDVKVSLLDQRRPGAVAVRAGFGVGGSPLSGTFDTNLQVGVLGSYDLGASFSSYAAIVFANHWVSASAPTTPLPAGTVRVGRAGYGDGVLELHAGFALAEARRQRGAYLEYVFWLPAQDDPGDNFKFAQTHIIELIARF